MRAPWASHYGIFSFFRHFPQRLDDCRRWPEPQRAFGFILRHQSSISIRRDPVRLGARAGFIPYGSRVTPLLPASKHLSRRNFIAKARPPRSYADTRRLFSGPVRGFKRRPAGLRAPGSGTAWHSTPPAHDQRSTSAPSAADAATEKDP